jgi:hypothetical protein
MRMPKRIELVEGTLLGLAAVSGAILIFEPFFPTAIHAARERLMPALVCGLLIHIWNMSVEIRHTSERHAQSVDDVREAVQQASERHAQALENLDDAVRATAVRTFANQSEFHVYIRSRFSTASRIQVTHFASRSLSMHHAEYRNIADEFITRGGKYYRVICDSLDPEIWRDQQEWMTKYADKQFFLHYLRHVAVDNMKLMDIMLIDDDEVCSAAVIKADSIFQLCPYEMRTLFGFIKITTDT